MKAYDQVTRNEAAPSVLPWAREQRPPRQTPRPPEVISSKIKLFMEWRGGRCGVVWNESGSRAEEGGGRTNRCCREGKVVSRCTVGR